MLKRSKKILLEGTLSEFRNYPRGAEGREYVLMNIEEKGPDGSYAFYEKDEKGDIIPVSYKGTEGYDATEFIQFTDPEFERIILANFNTNPKMGITTKEADSITDIGQLFQGNTALVTTEDLALLKNVKTIPETAFQGCTNLQTAIIPEQIKNLENNCFDQCSNLKVVKVYGNAQLPTQSASFGQVNLDSIEFYGTKTLNIGIGQNTNAGSAFLNNSIDTISPYTFLGFSDLTDINIPESVTVIGSGAFKGCTSLKSIEIPDSVTKIGSGSFSGCTTLTSIELPNSVTEIGSFAFSGCTSLTSIEIPNSVTKIGGFAFSGCTNLFSIELPSSIATIEGAAFQNCTGLTYIKCYRETPASFLSTYYGNPFENITSTCTLYVPINSLEAYQTADYWKDFQSIVGFEPEVQS